MKSHLERELNKLKGDLVYLGTIVEDNVKKAVMAKDICNKELAKKIILRDKEVDDLEIKIEEECLKLLALYQPIATDLRLMVAILKINDSLEQIGDLAKEISVHVISLCENQVRSQFDFSVLSSKVQWMVRNSIKAVVEMDPELALSICKVEDEVDDLSSNLNDSIINAIEKHPDQVIALTDELFISGFLEQMADFTKKIAEDVIYAIKAEIIRHKLFKNP